jgi:hypothetical protein
MIAFFLLLVIAAAADAMIPHQILMRRAFVVHTGREPAKTWHCHTGPEGLAGAGEAADGSCLTRPAASLPAVVRAHWALAAEASAAWTVPLIRCR